MSVNYFVTFCVLRVQFLTLPALRGAGYMIGRDVCVSLRSATAAACGGFAAERRPAGGIDRLLHGAPCIRRRRSATAAPQHGCRQHGAQQQMQAVSC